MDGRRGKKGGERKGSRGVLKRRIAWLRDALIRGTRIRGGGEDVWICWLADSIL